MFFFKKDINFFRLLILTISITLSLCAQNKENVFTNIANEHLYSYARPTLTPKEILSVINPNTNEIDRKKIKQILEQKTRESNDKKIVLNLLSEWAKEQNLENQYKNQCKTSEMLLQNLEVLCGQNNTSSHLLSKISRTRSIVGNIMLAKMLIEPTTNISELLRRQQIIKELVNNEELFTQLDNIVKNYHKIEHEFLSFWEERTFNRLFSSDHYFPPYPLNIIFSFLPEELSIPESWKHKVNQSPGLIGLEGLTIWNNLETFHALQMILTTGIPAKWEAVKRKWELFKKGKPPKLNVSQKSKDWFSSLINLLATPITWPIKKVKNTITNQLSTKTIREIEKFNVASKIGFLLGDILLSTSQIYRILKQEKRKLKTLKIAYSKLKKAALTINSLLDIKEIINSSSVLSENIKCLESINFFFENKISQSKEFDTLLKQLSSSTFKGNKAVFSYLLLARGKILATSYLMSKTQNHLLDFVSAIGQIDAYLSITKLYKEYLNEDVGYCFASYSKQENPYIKSKDFWTPFINPQTVVTNNIELGNINSPRNAIISGPNAGGKSTILKSIIINALLAQTLTIAPSSEITLTPFDYLDTYLNIIDDISSGKSLFKAEVLRVKQLIQTIKDEDLKKCLIIMDEMFSGTNPLEGEAASYAIGKFLSKFKNSILLVASHYPKMTFLEEQTNGIFKNYKVSVIKDSINNKLIYPFKLEEGKTNQAIAIEILKHENFDSQVIQDAYNIIENNIC